ncbi:MAG TPA: hypothetical protein VIW29_02055 [Polyangiaceae bacterium]
MRVPAALASALALLAGCGGAAPGAARAPARPALTAGAVAPEPGRPRLYPPTQGVGVIEAGVHHDGSRRLLALGLRVTEHLDGSLEVGDELLPAARSAKFLELPERFGSGFLFWIVSSSATLLYRSTSWTAKLEPVAQLDFEVERVVPGFDRLLILPRRDADYRALDLETGQALPPLGLPPAPAYGQTVFVDGWFGAVQVPLRGVLLSFDAGSSWRPLSLPVTALEAAGSALSITTPTAEYLLSARGELAHVADRDAAQASAAAQAELARISAQPALVDHGRVPMLQTAVLTGFPDGRGNALLASSGTLFRVRLDGGRVIERRERAYGGAGECQGVRWGAQGVAFVCGDGQALTRIYGVTEPLGLQPLLELEGARAVSSSGNGGLVIHGGCRARGSALDHCVVSPSGSWRDVRASSERARLVALGDGRAAALTPPSSGRPGFLELDAGSGWQKIPLALTRKEPRATKLMERGVWLDGMVESKPGLLQGWVVGAGPFAGFEVTLEGKLSLRRIQDNSARALFDGPRVLVLGDSGLASESTDGGAEWQGVELPPELDLKPVAGSGLRQGCSEIGCSFAGFTRVGYFGARAARSLQAPAAPPRITFPGSGGSRWVLHCEPTGEVSRPALPLRPASPAGRRRLSRPASQPADEQEAAPLSPLLDRPPPSLAENHHGVDAGTEPYGVQVRVYAYGPRGTDWTKTGSLSIAFADRFSVEPGVHVTATARSPWVDLLTAADALGAEPSTSAAGIATALDPSGTAGALLLSSRGTLELFVFEAGRVPQRIPNVGRLGMAARFSGVVKTKAGVFLGSYDESSRSFRVYQVVGTDLEVVLEVSDIPPPRGANAELLRSAAGDALAIGVRGSSWFVHPLDLENATVDAPYQVTPSQLASMPEPCSEGAEGFLMTTQPGPDPYASELPGGMTARSFEGRFRVSALGICVDRLAAQGESGGVGRTAASKLTPGRPAVAVTLTERKPLGRRVGLRCSN